MTREKKRRARRELLDRRLAHTLIYSGTILLLVAFFLMQYNVVAGLFSKLLGILRPVIIGLVLALMLHKPVCRVCEFLERKTKGHRFPCNPIAILLVYLIFLGILAGLICIVVPQFTRNILDFSLKFNDYYDNLVDFFQNDNTYLLQFQEATGIDPQSILDTEKLRSTLNDLISKLVDYLPTVAEKIASWTTNILNVIIDIFMGVMFSIYMLIGRKRLRSQMQRILKRFCNKRHYRLISHYGHMTFDTFSSFISGQMAEAVILGVLCFIAMNLFHLEYPLMVSVVIGCTNLIPIIGPIIGTIPGAFILLLINPWHAVFFVILVIVLQQIDNNLIYPRVVGSSIGLPALWVLFAITVGGGLFGILGTLLGVPCMSVIYTIIREKVNGLSRQDIVSKSKRKPFFPSFPRRKKQAPKEAEPESEATAEDSAQD